MLQLLRFCTIRKLEVCMLEIEKHYSVRPFALYFFVSIFHTDPSLGKRKNFQMYMYCLASKFYFYLISHSLFKTIRKTCNEVFLNSNLSSLIFQAGDYFHVSQHFVLRNKRFTNITGTNTARHYTLVSDSFSLFPVTIFSQCIHFILFLNVYFTVKLLQTMSFFQPVTGKVVKP